MASPNPQGSPSAAAADQLRLHVTVAAASPLTSQMVEGNNENVMDVADLTDASTGEKRKRDGKVRSVVWLHFTKLIREDGTCDKCKCNHCNKLFTCSSRSGTTHLLRHITEGICPVFKLDRKDNKPHNNNTSFSSTTSGNTDRRGSIIPWKFDNQPLAHPPIEMHNDLLVEGLEDLDRQTGGYPDGDFVGQSSTSAYAKLSQQNAHSQSQPSPESWMNELRACTNKLVKLTNELPNGISFKNSSALSGPDYSIGAAIKCLNEMEDAIPESSTTYLDALDIVRDPGERECFLCLNPDTRRRWLRRMLHRRNPLRYNTEI